jgi:hypothetical protein
MTRLLAWTASGAFGRDPLGEAPCATGNFLVIGTRAERPADVSDDDDPQFVLDRQLLERRTDGRGHGRIHCVRRLRRQP